MITTILLLFITILTLGAIVLFMNVAKRDYFNWVEQQEESKLYS